MLTDLRNFFLWVVLLMLVIGMVDTYFYQQPTDNETENLIIRPSYNRSFMSHENQ